MNDNPLAALSIICNDENGRLKMDEELLIAVFAIVGGIAIIALFAYPLWDSLRLGSRNISCAVHD